MPTYSVDQSVFTYQDAIERLGGYVSQNAQAPNAVVIKQTVLEVYDDLVNARDWAYLNRSYRLESELPETGTLSYSASTGEFTIDTGTFPAWAELAIVQVGDVWSLVKTRSSSTVLVADDVMRPIADIATGTAFSIYKAIYPLSFDLKSMGNPLDESDDGTLAQVEFSDWMARARYDANSGNELNTFALAGHPYVPGRYVLLAHPYADTNRTLDFPYQRYPRRLRYNGYDSPCRTGTITAAGVTTITGTSTLFESDMVGAILRFARTASVYPEGIGGTNAYKQQVYVTSFSTTTSIGVHEAVTVTANQYTISDPLDLPRPLLDAFWRACEWKLSVRLKLPAVDRAEMDYVRALEKAKDSDSPIRTRRSAWGPRRPIAPFGRTQIITGGGDDD